MRLPTCLTFFSLCISFFLLLTSNQAGIVHLFSLIPFDPGNVFSFFQFHASSSSSHTQQNTCWELLVSVHEPLCFYHVFFFSLFMSPFCLLISLKHSGIILFYARSSPPLSCSIDSLPSKYNLFSLLFPASASWMCLVSFPICASPFSSHVKKRLIDTPS